MNRISTLTILALFIFAIPAMIWAQKLEVDGKAKIAVMEVDNNADSLVVRLNDGTLGIRAASTLTSNPGGNSSSPWYLGKDTLGGIVFYIYKGSNNQEKGLIVSKTEGYARWENAPEVLRNANRSWDGAYNTGLMNNSPAKDYVTNNYTSDWYIPSVDELVILFNHRFHVNNALQDSTDVLLRQSDAYYASTEKDQMLAWYVFFSNGNVTNSLKSISRYIRPVRGF